MINEELIERLKESFDKTLFLRIDLTARIGGSGKSSDFEETNLDIDSILSIAQDLAALPLQYLTKNAATQITQNMEVALNSFREMISLYDKTNSFDSDNVDLQAAKHASHTAVTDLIEVASQWIPYLVHLGGEFPKGIKKIKKVATDTEDAALETMQLFVDKRDEVEKIVQATKEAAAEVTVARFTEQFDTEANSLAKQSERWLYATSAFAACTIGAAIYSYIQFELPGGAGTGGILGHTLSKLSVIAVLLTGTLWCGRIYRALVHQVTINRHRALSLQTFQAFVKATDDPRVKDSVLMAATKTIFGTVPTGLVDQAQSGQDSNAQIVEVINSTARATRQAVGKASE